MNSETQRLDQGTHTLLKNNGAVAFFSDTGKRTNFAPGWMAEGIRKQLGARLPAVGEKIVVDTDVVVVKPRALA